MSPAPSPRRRILIARIAHVTGEGAWWVFVVARLMVEMNSSGLPRRYVDYSGSAVCDCLQPARSRLDCVHAGDRSPTARVARPLPGHRHHLGLRPWRTGGGDHRRRRRSDSRRPLARRGGHPRGPHRRGGSHPHRTLRALRQPFQWLTAEPGHRFRAGARRCRNPSGVEPGARTAPITVNLTTCQHRKANHRCGRPGLNAERRSTGSSPGQPDTRRIHGRQADLFEASRRSGRTRTVPLCPGHSDAGRARRDRPGSPAHRP